MSAIIEKLPTLGVGASLSLSSKPDPVALVNSVGGPSFVEYAGLVDVNAVIDEIERIRATGASVLFHPSYINFCGSFSNSSVWLEDTALWAHLSKTPLSASLRNKTLANEDPKLFITRAHVSTSSRCKTTVDHQTAELTEGFAPLFQHVNGSMSIAQILEQLRQSGAPEGILEGVQAGFQQLLTTGMLELT